MSCDFIKAPTEVIFHYKVSEEPGGQKLEPHGQLARTWPAFEEQATFMAEHWIKSYGDFYRASLLSTDPDPNGKPWGLLFVLKDLHRLAEDLDPEISRPPGPVVPIEERGEIEQLGTVLKEVEVEDLLFVEGNRWHGATPALLREA